MNEFRYYARYVQRSIQEAASGKRKIFARERFSNSAVLENWYSVEVRQPIIKPPGQEDIFNNKIHNIGIVIGRTDLVIIDPGQIFSFWYLVGNPTAKKGYKSASVFLCNKVTREMGGGLCQISTAIYGAALHAGCGIVERHAHSMDAYDTGRYFSLGQDATITFPHKDLQFKNIFSEPIVLRCRIKDNFMIARILSPRKFCEVKVESKLIGTVPRKIEYIKDNSMGGQAVVVQEGSDGKTVETRRTIKFEDGRTRQQFISTDTYKQVPRIIEH